MVGFLEVVLHSSQALGHKHKLLRAKTAALPNGNVRVLPKGNAAVSPKLKAAETSGFRIVV